MWVEARDWVQRQACVRWKRRVEGSSAFQKTPRILSHHHGLGLHTLDEMYKCRQLAYLIKAMQTQSMMIRDHPWTSSEMQILSCLPLSLPADTCLTLYSSCVLVKSVGSVEFCNSPVSWPQTALQCFWCQTLETCLHAQVPLCHAVTKVNALVLCNGIDLCCISLVFGHSMTQLHSKTPIFPSKFADGSSQLLQRNLRS